MTHEIELVENEVNKQLNTAIKNDFVSHKKSSLPPEGLRKRTVLKWSVFPLFFRQLSIKNESYSKAHIFIFCFII